MALKLIAVPQSTKSETKISPQYNYNYSCNLTPNKDACKTFASSRKQKVK